MRVTFYLSYFGFLDPGNIDIHVDAKINFLSILFAEIWGYENSFQTFGKWLPQPPHNNIIATFGFLDPENIDVETIINFVSTLYIVRREVEH